MPDPRPFQQVMAVVVENFSSVKKATNFVGISTDTYKRLTDENEVTYSVGTKIMNAYSKLRETKNEAHAQA